MALFTRTLVVSDRNLVLVLKKVTDIVVVGNQGSTPRLPEDVIGNYTDSVDPLEFIMAHCNDIIADLS